MRKLFDFMTQLRLNNNREWFAAHRKVYDSLRAQADAYAERFLALVAEIEPKAASLRLADCSYRINRDTRFSADKSPYKTHIGYFVCPPYGKKSLLSGYYLHLEPGASMICGGNYGLPSGLLKAVRKDIYENIDEYMGIVDDPEFKRLYPAVGEERLKTAPAGYDKNWEYIDYLRPKDYSVAAMLPDSFFYDSDPAKLRPYIEQAKRLNDFVNFAITESGLEFRKRER